MCRPLVIEVSETDGQRAKQVIAEKTAPAPIQREFQPRVIPSKASWVAAREGITELEREIGKSASAKLTEEAPKAWRNYDGEDGWDAE